MLLSPGRGGRRRDDAGAVAVVAAISASVLLVIAGLVADLGQARDVRLQAQNGADAAALAAANAIYAAGTTPDLAAGTAAARAYAAQNYGVTAEQWDACVDPHPLPVASGTHCISYDAPEATTVRVVMPVRDVDTPFGAVAGIDDVPVGAAAEASVEPGGRAKCGLCVVGEGPHDIQNGDVAIGGSSAFFNGSVIANPQGSLTVTGDGSVISVEGTVSNKGTFEPVVLENQPPVQDPLAFLSLPPNMAGLTAKTGSACTGGPGIYYNTFQLTGDCTLAPGLYVLAGDSVEHESGQTAITAHGVTMYFTCAEADRTPRACAPGEQGAGLLITGEASLTIAAPTEGPTQGISIMTDRNNTATFGFRGNGVDASSGTIYSASGTLDYRGNGSGSALDALIVVNTLTFSGNNAALSSVYTEENNLGLPPARPHLSR